MTPIFPSLSPLFEVQLPRNISGTDFGTGYGGTVCGFHTRPLNINSININLTVIIYHSCFVYGWIQPNQ